MKVLLDGCFDVFHYGHANAIRQSKAFGDRLVVSVNTSETIAEYKNTPIMTDAERIAVISGVKWVDEVITSPYMLDYNMVVEHKIDLIVHGDDEVFDSEGNDCYGQAKAEGKFTRFERTLGISTTEIVGRMLFREKRKKKVSRELDEYQKNLLGLFSNENKYDGGKIVFLDGTFDMFHAGHASIIEAAKKRGDYLIIGLHSDNEIYKFKGEEPIMRTMERKLCLLSNKNIDLIIDNSPFILTQEFIKKYNINEIVCGNDLKSDYKHLQNLVNVYGFENEFSYLNVNVIVQRILDNYNEYIKKIEKSRKSLKP